MSHNELKLSSLCHTWILDIDGTIVKHNGYKANGKDTFLPGAELFLKSLPDTDMVIFLTSREKEYSDITEKFFEEHGIRYNQIIYNAPYGERILVNDDKPSGLLMSYCVSKKRDEALEITIEIDKNL